MEINRLTGGEVMSGMEWQSITPAPLRIADYYDDGSDARHFYFELLQPPSIMPEVQAGQFFMLVLPGFGSAPFTYVSAPDKQGRFYALVRNVGELTDALFEKNIGDVLGYLGPLGNGWPLDNLKKHLLLIAGGCGLAPLAALINSTLYSGKGSHLSLAYFSRDQESKILGKERHFWSQKMPIMETVDFFTAGEGQGEQKNALDKFIEQLPQEPNMVFCCGPEPMMDAAAEYCLARGLAAENVWLSTERRMGCGTGTCGHCYVGETLVCKEGPNYRLDHWKILLDKSGANTQVINQPDHSC
jgi:anaerobic sulfite reductase subunit B